jgi:hypothetical protein
VDTFDDASDIHRRLATQYQRENPWMDEAGALAATAFEAEQQLAEREEGDRRFKAMMDRLYPEFARLHDEYARAVAEGREPPVPARPPRHTPIPHDVYETPGTEPGPALPALGLPGTGAARAAYGRISPRHGEAALRYLRRHECTWAEAVAATAEGG